MPVRRQGYSSAGVQGSTARCRWLLASPAPHACRSQSLAGGGEGGRRPRVHRPGLQGGPGRQVEAEWRPGSRKPPNGLLWASERPSCQVAATSAATVLGDSVQQIGLIPPAIGDGRRLHRRRRSEEPGTGRTRCATGRRVSSPSVVPNYAEKMSILAVYLLVFDGFGFPPKEGKPETFTLWYRLRTGCHPDRRVCLPDRASVSRHTLSLRMSSSSCS